MVTFHQKPSPHPRLMMLLVGVLLVEDCEFVLPPASVLVCVGLNDYELYCHLYLSALRRSRLESTSPKNYRIGIHWDNRTLHRDSIQHRWAYVCCRTVRTTWVAVIRAKREVLRIIDTTNGPAVLNRLETVRRIVGEHC
jgi:hypothetical protein